MGEEGFKRLFDKIAEQAKQKGLTNGELKILDTTYLQADIALRGAVNFLRDAKTVVNKDIKRPPQRSLYLGRKIC